MCSVGNSSQTSIAGSSPQATGLGGTSSIGGSWLTGTARSAGARARSTVLGGTGGAGGGDRTGGGGGAGGSLTGSERDLREQFMQQF
jgi:hypothetical protein